MRTVTMIVVHCSAVKPEQRSPARDIDRWHRQRGWSMIGYHYVVRRDGTVELGRPLAMAGAHCRGHNAHSVAVCYEGGLDHEGRPADTRTLEQKRAMEELVRRLRGMFPRSIVVGHHDLNPQKACPCFDAAREYAPLPPAPPEGKGEKANF